MLPATPPPLVDVKPTREVRTASPVNEVAVDGGRAATLVGTAQAWEYLLVWSPQGVVVRASLACDTQENNLVLAGNRFAHLCFQGENFVVTGTVRPLRARVALRRPGAEPVSLVGSGTLVAGSAGRVLWRFDRTTRTKLRTYPQPVVAVGADGGRILVDRDARTLDVVSGAGRTEATLRLPHDGGALLRSGRIATISKRRLTVSAPSGRTILTRRVRAGAHLDDFDGGYVVYSVETRLHLLRLGDGRDVALRLRGQFGYAHAKLSSGGLFLAYDTNGGSRGLAGFVSPAAVRALLEG